MPIDIAFSKSPPARQDTAVLCLFADLRLGVAGAALDKAAGGLIAHQLAGQKKFFGKKGQTMSLSAGAGAPYRQIVLLGLGERGAVDALAAETAGGKLYAALSGLGAAKAAVFLEADGMPAKPAKGKTAAAPISALTPDVLIAHLAAGFRRRAYRFDKYRAKPKEEDAPTLSALTLVTPAAAAAKSAYETLDAVTDGIFFARDLANEPANVLYPESFAKIVRDRLKPLGVEVEIFDDKKLAKLGFGAHVAIGEGSARPPYAVVMRWPGAGGKAARGKKGGGPLAFVGKGVTFDTGGISIKPAAGMEDMKFDMCGAAAVVGLMISLATRRSPAEVVGIIGLAENMPSRNAARPGDIVTTLSGKTVEILNTDAEGRMVLCDALTYIQRTYDPKLVINLATLTGAIVVALGGEYAGAFVNDDALWNNLNAAGQATGEKLWRMPLDEAYRKAMESSVADLRNISTMGRDAGACTAAGYLEQFIDKGRPWAHLDIAGTAWMKADKPTAPKPAPGYGVQLLDRLVADFYEV